MNPVPQETQRPLFSQKTLGVGPKSGSEASAQFSTAV